MLAAAEVVQNQAGPPAPGTYRHDFAHDTTPRELPVSKRRIGRHTEFFGLAQTDNQAAIMVLGRLNPHQLQDICAQCRMLLQG